MVVPVWEPALKITLSISIQLIAGELSSRFWATLWINDDLRKILQPADTVFHTSRTLLCGGDTNTAIFQFVV